MASDDDDGLSSFSVEVGQRLRAVRRLRKLSLDDVEICCDVEHHVVNAAHTHPDVVTALEGTHWFEVNEWATTGPGADAGSSGAAPHAA